MSIETVVECATPTIGEGPHWDDATQSLLWVDIIDGILFRWDSKTTKHETHKFGKPSQNLRKYSLNSESRMCLCTCNILDDE